MAEGGCNRALGQQPGSTDNCLIVSNARYSMIESPDGSVTFRIYCGNCLTESAEILLNSQVLVDTSNNRVEKTETAMKSLSLDSTIKSRGNSSYEQGEKDSCAKNRNGDEEDGVVQGETDRKDLDKAILDVNNE